MPRRVLAYVTAVVTAAAVSLLVDGLTSGHEVLGRDPAAFWLLAACGLITELLPMRWLAVADRGEVTGSWTFVMAMLLMASPIAAVGATAFLFLVADLRYRKEAVKIAFNVGGMVLSLSAGALLMTAAGQAGELTRTGRPDLLWFPVAAVACAVVFTLNTALTCIVVAMSAGLPVRSVIREHGADALPTDAMLLALAPIFVITAQRSLLMVPPLLATTAIVYRTARLSLSRRYDSTHDLLTGAANRRLFDQRLGNGLDSLKNERLALVLVDLDGFKEVNDNLGHQVGDQVLVEVARRLESACRAGDLVARLGGDEFALILTRVDDDVAATRIAARILEQFRPPIEIDGIPVAIGASAGLAVAPDHGSDAHSLLRRADEALYAAKADKNTLRLWQAEQGKTAIGRLSLLNDLASALETDELYLEYQPQVALADERPVAAEALIRWNHPAVGNVPPGAFMPLAEQTDLIGAITERVLRMAIAQLARWREEGRDLRIAVNVSVRNLESPEFPALVESVLAAHGVEPSALVVELTENTMALERTAVRACLHRLSELGVAIAIDDFGTGYSSIVQLRELPVDQIKLDRRFVARMADDARDGLIVRAILQLAAALGVETVGEGVEEPLVAGLLRDLGCEQGQGYLFARPMRAAELSDWMDRRERWTLPGTVEALDLEELR